jgi:6-phosphogluconolactonase
MFAVDPKTGTLRSTGWAPSQGKTPRYIALDPSQRFLYVTNEQSDTVVPFRVDRKTGHLTATGQSIKNGTPVTIAFSSAI